MSAAEAEALYMERFAALRDRTGRGGLSSYDPLQAVPGAEGWTSLPMRAADERRIPAAALARADAAGTKFSTAS